MAFTYADSSEASNNAASIDVTYAGLGTISAGDLIVALWGKSNQAPTLSSSPADLGSAISSASNGNQQLRAYLRVATGSETGDLTWATSSGCNQAGIALRYAVGATPSLAAQATNTGTGTTGTCPDANATQAGDLILRLLSVQGSAAGFAQPGTPRENIQSGAAAGLWLFMAEQIAAGAGPVGTADFTWTGSLGWLTATVIITEAGGGSSVYPHWLWNRPRLQLFGRR